MDFKNRYVFAVFLFLGSASRSQNITKIIDVNGFSEEMTRVQAMGEQASDVKKTVSTMTKAKETVNKVKAGARATAKTLKTGASAAATGASAMASKGGALLATLGTKVGAGAATATAAGAGVVAAAGAVVGGIGAGIARAAMKANAKKLCAAHFVQLARKGQDGGAIGKNGRVDYKKVKASLSGILKNRTVYCTYTAGNGQTLTAIFNHREKTGSLGKLYKQYCKEAKKTKCKRNRKKTCLKNAPLICIHALADK